MRGCDMMGQTVTIFNRYDASATEVRYYASVIDNVHLQVDRQAAINKSGLKDADSMWCSVPYTVNGDGIWIGGKRMLPPLEWSKQVSDDMEQSLTFDEGRDILIDGVWDGPQVVNAADYSRTGFLSYLRSVHDGVYLINSVGRYDLIPHFELGGN